MPAPPAPAAPAVRAWLPALALLGVTVVWGSTFLVTKGAVDRVPVPAFLFWRFLVASAVLALAHPRGLRRLDAATWRRGVVVGFFLGTGFLAQTYGLRITSATVSGFVTGLFVVLAPLVAWLAFGERVDARAWAGVALALVGLGFLSLQGFSVSAGAAVTALGALLFAVQVASLSAWARPHEAVAFTAVQCAVAAAVAGLAGLADGGLAPPGDGAAWAAVVYLGVFASSLGFGVQTWAQSHLPASRSVVIMSMEPVFAGVFGVAVGGDELTGRIVAGGALVVAAMLLVELGPRRSRDVAAMGTEL